MLEEAIGACFGRKHKGSRKRENARRAGRTPSPRGQERNFEEQIRSFKGQERSFKGQKPSSKGQEPSSNGQAPSFKKRTLAPPDGEEPFVEELPKEQESLQGRTPFPKRQNVPPKALTPVPKRQKPSYNEHTPIPEEQELPEETETAPTTGAGTKPRLKVDCSQGWREPIGECASQAPPT